MLNPEEESTIIQSENDNKSSKNPFANLIPITRELFESEANFTKQAGDVFSALSVISEHAKKSKEIREHIYTGMDHFLKVKINPFEDTNLMRFRDELILNPTALTLSDFINALFAILENRNYIKRVAYHYKITLLYKNLLASVTALLNFNEIKSRLTPQEKYSLEQYLASPIQRLPRLQLLSLELLKNLPPTIDDSLKERMQAIAKYFGHICKKSNDYMEAQDSEQPLKQEDLDASHIADNVQKGLANLSPLFSSDGKEIDDIPESELSTSLITILKEEYNAESKSGLESVEQLQKLEETNAHLQEKNRFINNSNLALIAQLDASRNLLLEANTRIQKLEAESKTKDLHIQEKDTELEKAREELKSLKAELNKQEVPLESIEPIVAAVESQPSQLIASSKLSWDLRKLAVEKKLAPENFERIENVIKLLKLQEDRFCSYLKKYRNQRNSGSGVELSFISRHFRHGHTGIKQADEAEKAWEAKHTKAEHSAEFRLHEALQKLLRKGKDFELALCEATQVVLDQLQKEAKGVVCTSKGNFNRHSAKSYMLSYIYEIDQTKLGLQANNLVLLAKHKALETDLCNLNERIKPDPAIQRAEIEQYEAELYKNTDAAKHAQVLSRHGHRFHGQR